MILSPETLSLSAMVIGVEGFTVGGRSQPVVAHLIESGKLTLEDVKEAEKLLRKLERKDKLR
jgi:hypothetical protein